ncbi:MAG TPA: ferritin-like domain-containing protein, partial [Flavobacteriales bacterium]|nr:ferritin-like domain-containing protein [Flavobacteriales bacterium]
MASKNKPTGLRKLFEDLLADIYYAEKKIASALKTMTKEAQDGKLSKAFESHHKETQVQIDRLEKVFKHLDLPVKGKKCEAIEGLLKEAKELMDEFKDDPALDAALVCAAQKVEHYEMASYGCLVTYAEELGLSKAADLLKQTLKEEHGADEKLSQLADPALNRAGEKEGTKNSTSAPLGALGKKKAKKEVKKRANPKKKSSKRKPE